MSNWTNCPYLVENLVGILVFLVGWWFAKSQRQMMVLAGLSLAPFFPFYAAFQGWYWLPARLGGLPSGIEDAMSMFLIGSVPWLAAVWPFQDSIRVEMRWPLLAKRFLYLGAFGASVFLLLWFSGLDALSADTVANYFLAGVVLLLRRDLWPISLCGFLTYLAVYCLHLKLVFSMVPDFALAWNDSSLWSSKVLGLPLGEITAAGSMGCGFRFLLLTSSMSGSRRSVRC